MTGLEAQKRAVAQQLAVVREEMATLPDVGQLTAQASRIAGDIAGLTDRVTGAELAHAYLGLGCAVTLISSRDRVLPGEDADAAHVVEEVFRRPRHPYTQKLLSAFPNIHADRRTLEVIPGSPPDLRHPPPGCPFAPRCPAVMPVCTGFTTTTLPCLRAATSPARDASWRSRSTASRSRSAGWPAASCPDAAPARVRATPVHP